MINYVLELLGVDLLFAKENPLLFVLSCMFVLFLLCLFKDIIFLLFDRRK